MTPVSLAELAEFSAQLGGDPEQVQAAGGNTSLKDDGLLWVKASGLWLADALQRELFVPVALDPVLDGIAAQAVDPVTAAVAQELNPAGLRPSIETTLHALLPHRVVVHTHSVRTIALAIRSDGESIFAERLAGLAWAWIPYCKPGLPLTVAVAARLRDRPADVLVLGNHGLVVGADSVAAADALLQEVERRLDGARERPACPGAPPPIPGWRDPAHALVHTLAVDPARGTRLPRLALSRPRHLSRPRRHRRPQLRAGQAAARGERRRASGGRHRPECRRAGLVPRPGPGARPGRGAAQLPHRRRGGGAPELGRRAVPPGAGEALIAHWPGQRAWQRSSGHLPQLNGPAAGIAARKELVGTADARLIERARNKGAARSESKRQLLAILDEEARRRGRQPAFPTRF